MFLFVRISLGIFLLLLGSFIIFSVLYPPWRRKLRKCVYRTLGIRWPFIHLFQDSFQAGVLLKPKFKNFWISYYMFHTVFTGIVFIALAYLSFTGLLY